MVHANAAASSNGNRTQGHEQHSKAHDLTYSESLQCHIYCAMKDRVWDCKRQLSHAIDCNSHLVK